MISDRILHNYRSINYINMLKREIINNGNWESAVLEECHFCFLSFSKQVLNFEQFDILLNTNNTVPGAVGRPVKMVSQDRAKILSILGDAKHNTWRYLWKYFFFVKGVLKPYFVLFKVCTTKNVEKHCSTLYSNNFHSTYIYFYMIFYVLFTLCQFYETAQV